MAGEVHSAYTVFGVYRRPGSVDLITKLRNRLTRDGEERGAILILTAFVLMLLLFIAAFATDLGAWYRQGQAQQQAADVSSLNGVQAYDREVNAYLESFGTGTIWTDLSPAQRAAGEQQAMFAAVDTIVGLLETGGLVFNNTTPDSVSLAVPPNVAGDMSVVVLTAQDGTVVRIVRGVVELASGELVSTISVTLTAPGDQFFSSLFRDAPQISRTGESTVSNCGAECTQPVTIDPPFTGFNAGGSGDGFAPLLFGDESVWAINHHSNSDNRNFAQGSNGDIVCVLRETGAQCPGSPYSLVNYSTPHSPNEVLVEFPPTAADPVLRGKIYFPTTRRGFNADGSPNTAANVSGLGCFDVEARNFCGIEFLPIWPGDSNPNGSPAAGVFEHDGKVWVLSHFGQIACVNTNRNINGGMTFCDNNQPVDTSAFGTGNVTDLNQTGNRRVWGHVEGDLLYAMNRDRSNRAVFHCFNLDNGSPCNGWGDANGVRLADVRDNTSLAFPYYNTSGDLVAVCATRRERPNPAAIGCATTANGGVFTAPAGLTTLLANMRRVTPQNGNFVGRAFVWNEERLFLNGGGNERIVCWNFSTGFPCTNSDGTITNGIINAETLATPDAVTRNLSELGGGDLRDDNVIEPYFLAQVTEECLIGLGDESEFFSLSPERLTGCVDTITSTVIEPCLCTGTGVPNWAAVQLPDSLLNQVAGLEATVRDATPGAGGVFVNEVNPTTGLVEPTYQSGTGPIVTTSFFPTGIEDIDVGRPDPAVNPMATNGFVNLDGIDTSVLAVELQLKVETEIVGGVPSIPGTATFDLSVVSHPTLTN